MVVPYQRIPKDFVLEEKGVGRVEGNFVNHYEPRLGACYKC